MNTLSATVSLLTHSLVWALLYSLWQGLLIYGTLSVLLKGLPNVQERIKYILSMGSLAALFLWFADTWLSQYERLKGVAVYITQSGAGSISTSYSVKTKAGEITQLPLLHRIMPHVEYYFPVIIALYTIGLAFMLFRFLVNLSRVMALRRQGIMAPEAEWNIILLRWQRHFEIARPVKLFLSDRITSPVMLGTIKPIILLPVAVISHLTTEQVEAILLHELAHIKRHDYLLNMLQVITEAILFFNPFVWLLSGIIRKEREHCCDDLVVACSASPLPYARALVILESQRTNYDLAMAATGHKNQLFNRIKRIMEMKKSNINYSQLTIVAVAIVAITFTMAMFTFTPSFAQKEKGDTSDTTRRNVYHYKTVTVDKNGKKTVTERQGSTPEADDHGGNDETKDGDNNHANGKNAHTKTYEYTYSYSADDDLNKAMAAVKTAVDALANVDVKEIEKEIDESTKEIDAIDWDKVKDEINNGLDEVKKELNDPNLNKKINADVRKAMEKSKNAMEDAKEKLSAMPPIPPMPPVPPIPPMPPLPPAPPAKPFDREEGRTRSGNYEAMLTKMEKDGLIDRSDDYKVEATNGVLYIDGKEQPEDTYKRYEQYLKNQTVSIKYHNGTLKMVMHDR